MQTLANRAHSCSFCSSFILQGRNRRQSASETYGIETITQAMLSGCVFVEWIMGNGSGYSATGTVTVTQGKMESEAYDTPYIMELLVKRGYSGNTTAWRYFALDGNPSSREILARPFCEDPGSDESRSKCAQWKEQCDLNHPLCVAPSDCAMPRRLLYLGDVKDNKSVRLVDLEGKQKVDYTALSYCWGGDQKYKMTKESLGAWINGQPKAMLPATIKDAIDFTLKLEISHIWVDSICIVQDETEDMLTEISRMGDVYRGASVVISAARASHSDNGFLEKRMIGSYGQLLELKYMCEDGRLGSVICCRDLGLGTRSPRRDPIHYRAWTLQEAFLARRLITFGSRQTVWTCQETAVMDGGLYSLQDLVDFKVSSTASILSTTTPDTGTEETRQQGIIKNWNKIVQEYSNRSLTYGKDKLIAISGIASFFEQQLKSEYIAGLWKSDMPHCLLWQRTKSVQKDVIYQRPGYRGAPSWSWASIDGKIDYHGDTKMPISPYFKIVEIIRHYSQESQLFSKFDLVLSARFYSEKSIMKKLGERGECEGIARSGWMNVCRDAIEARDIDPSKLYLLEVCFDKTQSEDISSGLLVVHVDENRYMRVGRFSYGYSEDELYLRGCNKKRDWVRRLRKKTIVLI